MGEDNNSITASDNGNSNYDIKLMKTIAVVVIIIHVFSR